MSGGKLTLGDVVGVVMRSEDEKASSIVGTRLVRMWVADLKRTTRSHVSISQFHHRHATFTISQGQV